MEDIKEILEVKLVKEALNELLREQLDTDINDFASREKYISWQLSKIFIFPIDVKIQVKEQPFVFQVSFITNGTRFAIDATIN